jgi:hypothetical protein
MFLSRRFLSVVFIRTLIPVGFICLVYFPLLAMGYWLDSQGSIPGRGKIIFSTPQHPDRFWGPPSLLASGYPGHFPRGKAIWAWSSHLHLVLRSRMAGLYLHSPIRIHNIVFNCLIKEAQGQLYLLYNLCFCVCWLVLFVRSQKSENPSFCSLLAWRQHTGRDTHSCLVVSVHFTRKWPTSI